MYQIYAQISNCIIIYVKLFNYLSLYNTLASTIGVHVQSIGMMKQRINIYFMTRLHQTRHNTNRKK